jgi:hypothetical protein
LRRCSLAEQRALVRASNARDEDLKNGGVVSLEKVRSPERSIKVALRITEIRGRVLTA